MTGRNATAFRLLDSLLRAPYRIRREAEGDSGAAAVIRNSCRV